MTRRVHVPKVSWYVALSTSLFCWIKRFFHSAESCLKLPRIWMLSKTPNVPHDWFVTAFGRRAAFDFQSSCSLIFYLWGYL